MASTNGGGASNKHVQAKMMTEDSSDRIRLKPKIGLINGVMIIVGVIVGSGIFVSPTGVIVRAGSIGLSLIIWLLCGLFSLLGALSYAELGTSILKSGGDYAYIKDAFGDLPAFMFLWTALIITIPASNAVTALTFANYVLRPIYGYCNIGEAELRLVAAAILCKCFLNDHVHLWLFI
ncbi:unnamed protein product [Soboliphyme baturini]|uniref:Y+L amino acid transporter 2 n=1 Tax=Soboliphyme baturini TaxID=241478 RepID=A0A183IJI1_9BILA|nr:unnamed protein product [Soboliphyme baturini]